MHEHSKASISANNLLTPTQPKYSRNNISSRHESLFSPVITQHQLNENKDLTNKRHNIVVEKFNSISNSENKSFSQTSQTKVPQNSSISNYPASNIPFLSGEISASTDKMTMFTSSKIENKSSNPVNSESWKIQDSVFSTSSTPLFGKSAHFDIDKSHPGEGVLTVPSFGGSRDSSSQTIQTPLISPSSSSISSTTVPSPPVSVDLRSLIKSSTIQVESTSSTSAPPSSQASKHVSPSFYPPSFDLNLQPPTSEVQKSVIFNSNTDLETKDVNKLLVETLNNEAKLIESPNNEAKLVEPPNNEAKLDPKASENSSTSSASSSAQSTNNVTCSVSSNISVSQSEQRADAPMLFSTFPSSSTSGKTLNLDATITDEDEMEEEAPEMSSSSSEPNLGSFGGFGISTTPNPSTAKSNPFGGPFGIGGAAPPSPPMAFSVPSGELFRPASFTIPSSQPSSMALSSNSGAFSGGFSAVTSFSATPQSGFGQPAQVGSGQQALGSVLGSFGQSRQLGSGLPGSGPSGFGGGFGVSSSAVGFSSSSPAVGGFASISPTGGGFAAVASSGVGFSGVASSFGGFAGAASNAPSGGPAGSGFAAVAGGFAGAASGSGFAGAASGGGFGGHGNQGSGFGAFGAAGGTSKPPNLFTQMRK